MLPKTANANSSRISMLGLVAFAASATPAVPSPLPVDLRLDVTPLSRPHPGQPRATAATVEATELLKKGRALTDSELDRAVRLLEAALRDDPVSADAWTNWSAGLIRSCDPDRAMFAALTAREIEPANQAAARNILMARKIDCPPDADASGEVAALERRVLGGPSDPSRWRAAADARRTAGDRLLAAFYELVAARRGGPARADAVWSAHEDLVDAGMVRAGLELIAEIDDADSSARRIELEARLDRVAQPVARLFDRLSLLESFDETTHRAFVESVGEILLERGESPDAAFDFLKGVLGLGGARQVTTPWGTVELLPGWYAVDPPQGEGWPFALFRRFPGDTQVALYSVLPDAQGREKVDRFILDALAPLAPARTSDWTACESERESRCEKTELSVELGWGGGARIGVRLVEPAAPASNPAPRVAALTLVGDAGCRRPCRESAADELEELLHSLAFEKIPGPAGRSWRFPVPRAWRSDGDHREDQEAWRSYPAGETARIDMPPGMAVSPLVPGVRVDESSTWTELWFRGQFIDRDGTAVVVGDERFGGWVDVVPRVAPDRESRLATPAPRTDPGARLVGVTRQDELIRRIGTGTSLKIARYEGDEFDGEWLVSHVELAGSGALVELGIPVAKGIRSLSLLWLGLTARDASRAGPPPLVDLQESLAVRFDPIQGGDRARDPREGWLRSREFQLAVPRGFRVSLRAESADGFPLTLRAPNGSEGEIVRFLGSESASLESRMRLAESTLGADLDWDGPRSVRGGVSMTGASPAAEEEGADACVVLLVPSKPESIASYLVRFRRGHRVSDGEWATMCETVKATASLLKPPRRR